MHREVALEHLKLAGQLRVHVIEALEAAVRVLAEVVQLDEELAKHLFLDRTLVGALTLNLVPQLDLQRLAKRLLHLLQVKHVQLDEV